MLRTFKRWMSTSHPDSGISFSQCGEDRIVKWVLDVLRIQERRYLDIGAYHPRRLNNTFLFYQQGGSGVLVEPNPHRTALIRRERPGDICLNVGVAGESRSAVPFYVMKSDALCTFSKQEAERMVAECGEQIREVMQLEVLTPEAILSKHFSEGLNYVSLDVEGLELDILKAFDFERHRPEVFSVETISYAIDGSGRKDQGVIEFMESRGYLSFADTYVNTIFVDRSCWEALADRAGAKQ